MVALITGVLGQDGSYLAESLVSEGVEVYGISRRKGHLDNVEVIKGCVTDKDFLEQVIRDLKPDEIYNLAGVHRSHHRKNLNNSFRHITDVNANAVMNILEAVKQFSKSSRFFQAGSSEALAKTGEAQDVLTPRAVSSEYSCSKIMAENIVKYYRKCEGLFAVNGILFNHESPRRSGNFVTTKVVRTAVRISLGLDHKLEIGNLDAERDWGHAKDYVEAMKLSIRYKVARDWIIASGKKHSVRYICEYVFSRLGMKYRDHVVEKKHLKRQEDISRVGDINETLDNLRWVQKYTFEQMLDEMIDYWMTMEKKCLTQ